MFTGIVRAMGKIKNKKHIHGNVVFEIEKKSLALKIGDSISVNGVCLTVVKKSISSFWVDVVSETLKRTNLKELKIGTAVNLEPAMAVTDAVNGHFITGHIDAACSVTKIGDILEISATKKLMKFIFEKGSVAVNGVSLTVASINKSKNTFSIAVIPFTKTHTNLGALRCGEKVNIEVDILARYCGQKTAGKIGIVVSQYNKNITDGLLLGAQKAFQKNKIPKKNIEIVFVPGAFEIPLMLKIMTDSGQFKGLIALGCVIKGETDHYDAVCKGVTYGIQKISLEYKIPIMFGVLMCRNLKQAAARSDGNLKINKGYECANSLLNFRF